jgi:type I restriction enzyme S subunit
VSDWKVFSDKLLGIYLMHLLNFSGTRERIKRRIVSLLPRLNLTDISTFEILLPPIHEQCRIVEALDAYDVCIRKEEAELAKLRQVKRGLMDDLLTGRVRVPT